MTGPVRVNGPLHDVPAAQVKGFESLAELTRVCGPPGNDFTPLIVANRADVAVPLGAAFILWRR